MIWRLHIQVFVGSGRVRIYTLWKSHELMSSGKEKENQINPWCHAKYLLFKIVSGTLGFCYRPMKLKSWFLKSLRYSNLIQFSFQ